MTYTSLNSFDLTLESVPLALKQLDKVELAAKSMNFFMGFDGYVDLIYNMLKSRSNITDFEIYESMADYGKKVVETAGSSISIERVLKKKLAGGFAPNMARALANMAPESSVNLYAAMGYPEINPLFTDMPANVKFHSIGNSGETLAMEFADGKVMSQDMGGLFEIDCDTLVKRIGGRDAVIDAFNQSDAIGSGHWSLLLHMNDYFRYFISDILPNIQNGKKKLFFMDPADFAKKSNTEIREMLKLLGKIDQFIPVVLSLNDREAVDVARVLKEEGVSQIIKGDGKSYEEGGKNINDVLQLSNLVIHEPHFATLSSQESHVWISEGYTSKPRFTVAAGDHFNAGILLSKLSGLTSAEALVVANAATAIFVRTGISPTIADLKNYISEYMKYVENDVLDFK